MDDNRKNPYNEIQQSAVSLTTTHVIDKDTNDNRHTRFLSDMPIFQRILVFLSLSATLFLASFDLTVVTTVVPDVAAEFHALSNATWISTAYMLTTTALQPLYGRLSDIFGRVPVLTSAILLFAAGSAACGWAQSLGVLIFGRALQGVGGAGLLAMVFIITSDLTTEDERPVYFGGLNIFWTVSSTVGPVLGGVFSDKASWRWAFLINLPIAAVVLILIFTSLRLPLPQDSFWRKLKRVDILGSLLLIGAVVMLLLGLTWGGKTFPWSSARVICLLVFGVLLIGVFVIVEWKAASDPIVPLHLFTKRNVCLAVISQFFLWVGMYTVMFFVPIWYSVVKNSTALALGLHLLPYLISVAVVSIGTGILVSRTGHYRPVIIFGTLTYCVGCGLLILFDENTSTGKQIGFMLLMGIGLGLIIQTLLIAAQKAAPVEYMASATTLFMFMRVLGSSVGIAILQSVLQNTVIPKLDFLSARYPEYARVFSSSLNDQGAIYNSGLPDGIRIELIHYYVQALQRVFIGGAAFTGVGFLLVLGLGHIPFSRKVRQTTQ